jgi:hypothetical protein
MSLLEKKQTKMNLGTPILQKDLGLMMRKKRHGSKNRFQGNYQERKLENWLSKLHGELRLILVVRSNKTNTH